MSTVSTAPKTFAVGDKVTPDPNLDGVPRDTIGRVFTVEKVNKVNLKCSADDGGRGINFPPFALLPAGDGAPAPTIGRPFVPREFFSVGEIVTMKNPGKFGTTETPFVVIADKASKVNIARLGGDGDRYRARPPDRPREAGPRVARERAAGRGDVMTFSPHPALARAVANGKPVDWEVIAPTPPRPSALGMRVRSLRPLPPFEGSIVAVRADAATRFTVQADDGERRSFRASEVSLVEATS